MLTSIRVVDPRWPDWKDEYEVSEGPSGNVFTSTSAATAGAGGASAS